MWNTSIVNRQKPLSIFYHVHDLIHKYIRPAQGICAIHSPRSDFTAIIASMRRRSAKLWTASFPFHRIVQKGSLCFEKKQWTSRTIGRAIYGHYCYPVLINERSNFSIVCSIPCHISLSVPFSISVLSRSSADSARFQILSASILYSCATLCKVIVCNACTKRGCLLVDWSSKL